MILHLHSHFRGSLNNKFLHYRYVSRTIRLDHTMRVCKLLYCTAYQRCWLPPFKVSVTRNLDVEMISTWNKIPSWYHFYIEFLKYSLWRVVGCTFAALLRDAVSEFVCAKVIIWLCDRGGSWVLISSGTRIFFSKSNVISSFKLLIIKTCNQQLCWISDNYFSDIHGFEKLSSWYDLKVTLDVLHKWLTSFDEFELLIISCQ